MPQPTPTITTPKLPRLRLVTYGADPDRHVRVGSAHFLLCGIWTLAPLAEQVGSCFIDQPARSAAGLAHGATPMTPILVTALADAAAIAWAKQAQAALRDPGRVKFPAWPR
jgi:hypothetical protein